MPSSSKTTLPRRPSPPAGSRDRRPSRPRRSPIPRVARGCLLAAGFLIAAGACHRGPREARDTTALWPTVLPLTAITEGAEADPGRVQWTDHDGRRSPAVVVREETRFTLAVDRLGGLRIRGAYGLPGEARAGAGWSAEFQVSATADGRETRLLADRVARDDPRPWRPMTLELPAGAEGAGEIHFEVRFAGRPPDGATAAWVDPEVAVRTEALAGSATSRSDNSPSDDSPWNVVVVTADTTRSDVLGPYGGPAHTPALERLARDGVLFRGAHSAAYGTTPSHASLFTGSHPRDHGIYDNRTLLAPRFETLAEVLLASGYRTAAFVSGRPLSRSLGLDQGFSRYDDVFGLHSSAGLGGRARFERRARTTVDRFLRWLDVADEPFSAWLHFFDPHQPYAPEGGAPAGEPADVTALFEVEPGVPRTFKLTRLTGALPVPPETLDRAARRRYAIEVEHMDRQLGRVLAALERRGLYDRTLVVFVSDHGENFFDRGPHLAFDHAGLHADVTHLGLLIKLPESRHAGSERGFLLLNSDLPCLIVDVIGAERPAGWRCQSFLRHLDGNDDRTFRPYLILEGAHRQEVAVRTADRLYREARPDILGREEVLREIGFDPAVPVQLFDLRSDPGERDNLAERPDALDDVERFRALVAGFLEEAPSRAGRTLDSEEHLEALRALGYLD